MIQITAYLRDEKDLAIWKSLPNKTEWLHSVLSDSWRGQSIKDMPKIIAPPDKVIPMTVENPEGKTVVMVGKLPDGTHGIRRADGGLCKIHGTPLTDLGKCLQKGCKYA